LITAAIIPEKPASKKVNHLSVFGGALGSIADTKKENTEVNVTQ
jgi:hypothetical protein